MLLAGLRLLPGDFGAVSPALDESAVAAVRASAAVTRVFGMREMQQEIAAFI